MIGILLTKVAHTLVIYSLSGAKMGQNEAKPLSLKTVSSPVIDNNIHMHADKYKFCRGYAGFGFSPVFVRFHTSFVQFFLDFVRFCISFD